MVNEQATGCQRLSRGGGIYEVTDKIRALIRHWSAVSANLWRLSEYTRSKKNESPCGKPLWRIDRSISIRKPITPDDLHRSF